MKLGYVLLFFLLYAKATGHAEASYKEDRPNEARVVVVTLDGMRWQEVFAGADPVLLHQAMQDKKVDLQDFAGSTAAERRQRLMPFLWSEVAQNGQLVGNRSRHSKMNVANPYALSYAGYNELFTGRTDLRIWSNEKKQNVNRTIFEHLNKLQDFRGKVASVASWDAFPFILAQTRSKIKVAINKALDWTGDVCPDTATFAAAVKYLVQNRPRVLHIGLGGTDEAGHQKDYAGYLQQAHLADGLIGKLWQLLQGLPEYRNNTSLIITTDHGRGRSRSTWFKHGFFVPGSSETWMAMLGTGIRPGGESGHDEQLYSAQIAGTIGYLLRVNSFRPYTIPLHKMTADDRL
ncbi:alkaline phosphatase family protein [Paracnuella aquatica]|uniref:alkaline phosphatase family protein n=1 Tax=Paracnuella aquatica TaxID=2268757 RepID=UPI00138FD51B|nr:alkaline phosphatase family protein [Paracnuella aquatica]